VPPQGGFVSFASNQSGRLRNLFFVVGMGWMVQRRRRPAGLTDAAVGGAKSAGWNLRRFRRPLPLVYLLTAILAAFGGALHAPNNYDALTYRFPRMLHLVGRFRLHWISTPTLRMNVSGTDFDG